MHALTVTGLSSSLKLPSTQAHHKSTIISGNSLIPLCASMPAPLSCKNKAGKTRRNFIDKLEATDEITFLRTESKISLTDSRDIEQFFLSESSIISHKSSESYLTDIETIMQIYPRDAPVTEVREKPKQLSLKESSFKRKIMESSIRDKLKFIHLPLDLEIPPKSKSPELIWNIKEKNLPQKLPKLGPITPDHFNRRKLLTLQKPKVQERRPEDLGEISVKNPLEIAEELSKLEWNSGAKDMYSGGVREDEFEIEVGGVTRLSDLVYKVDVC
jgi:hypothetical protein